MITRDELYKLVWSTPMIKVAEQFGVSGSYMARVCSILRVPRPERGYWAKLVVGRAPAASPLPDARPGDQVLWSLDGSLRAAPAQKLVVPPRPPQPRASRPVMGTHDLITGVKQLFEASRPVDERRYLKPFKKLLPDITVTKEGLDKALAFASGLFNALEFAEHRVVLAPQGEQFRRDEPDRFELPKKGPELYYHAMWAPQRETVVYVGTVAIGLAIVEMSNSVLMRNIGGKYIPDADYVQPKNSRHNPAFTWTTTMDIPCGRLRLIAYCPYWRVAWSERWQETNDSPLGRDIPAIVQAIERAAAELVFKLEAADRKAEIERLARAAEEKKRRQEEERRRVHQSIKDSRTQLTEIIQAWSDAMDIERFFQVVEDSAAQLSVNERDAISERLRLAREVVGVRDTLEFFRLWMTPLERYQPQSAGVPGEVIDESGASAPSS